MPRARKPTQEKRATPWRDSWSQVSEGTSGAATTPAPPCNASFIRMAIDIGTTSTTVAYQLCHDDESNVSKKRDSTNVPTIHIAELEASENASPMLCRYDNSGCFLEGQALSLQLERGSLEENDVIRFSKLALQENETTRSVSKRVQAQLQQNGKTVDSLMSDYLQAVISKARSAITHRSVHGDASEVPVHLLLCVPEIWAPESNIALTEAAKTAGVVKSSPVPESLSVAACILHDEINENRLDNSALGVGHCILVADLGGGTADLVLFELCSTPNNRSNFAIKIIRPACGSLGAGSSQINRNFEHYLETVIFPTKKALHDHAADMGLKPTEFVARASRGFEAVKVRFPMQEKYNITVDGKLDARSELWTWSLERKTVESFFEPVMRTFLELIDECLAGVDNIQERLKAIVLCGGLGSSAHVHNVLDKYFPPTVKRLRPRGNHYNATVAKGALLRYSHPIQQPIGHSWSLCAIRNEEWNAELHPDAVKWVSVGKTGKKIAQPNHNVDFGEPDRGYKRRKDKDGKAILRKEDCKWEVLDRCFYILNGSTQTTHPKWAKHNRNVTDINAPLTLIVEIFMTEKPDPTNSEPCFVGKTRELLPAFRRFRTVEKVITDPASNGFELTKHEAGRQTYWTYTFYSCVTIRRTVDSIDVGVFIRNEEHVYHDDGKVRNWIGDEIEFSEEEWAQQIQPIWSKNFSHMSLEVTGVLSDLPASTRPTQSNASVEGTPMGFASANEINKEIKLVDPMTLGRKHLEQQCVAAGDGHLLGHQQKMEEDEDCDDIPHDRFDFERTRKPY